MGRRENGERENEKTGYNNASCHVSPRWGSVDLLNEYLSESGFSGFKDCQDRRAGKRTTDLM